MESCTPASLGISEVQLAARTAMLQRDCAARTEKDHNPASGRSKSASRLPLLNDVVLPDPRQRAVKTMTQTVEARIVASAGLVLAVVAAALTAPAHCAALWEKSQIRLVNSMREIAQPYHAYTTKTEGLGMGLSISRSIIEAHGGRLWATANEPHGAVFQFSLPVEAPRSYPPAAEDS